MKFPSYLVIVSIAALIVASKTEIAVALSPQQIRKIGQDLTVQIQAEDGTWGSGTIIKRTGEAYYVLTSFHVINRPSNYIIITPDRQTYRINNSSILSGEKLDLAVVKFASDRLYQTATIGNSDLLSTGTPIYIAGMSRSNLGFEILLRGGEVIANTDRLTKYNLIYTNNSLKGMSGGGIFNRDGQLVGIQGWGESNEFYQRFETVITGNARGIALNRFLHLRLIDLKVAIPHLKQNTKHKADDSYWLGLGKQKQEDYRGAIAAYNRAIQINSRYSYAYYKRGDVYYEQGKYRNSLNDFNRAIKLGINHVDAYNYRGLTRQKLVDNRGAIADYTQAISLDPQYYYAYDNRGNIYYKLKRYPQAIANYTQAIQINSNYIDAYINRSFARYEIGDLSNSINDLRRAIYRDQSSAQIHLALAVALYKYGKKAEAISLGKKAIEMNGQITDLKFLQQNKWGNNLLADTQRFLQIPAIEAIISGKNGTQVGWVRRQLS
jgi:tetratricopeptide (TPR) repeat protein